jgi:hypothetical protein
LNCGGFVVVGAELVVEDAEVVAVALGVAAAGGLVWAGVYCLIGGGL